jgi:molybdate transport system ATP-binding protein
VIFLIRLHSLSVDLGGFALKDINLHIAQGEIFALLGSTGAGKTVILEALAGLYAADEGTIYIGEHDVSNTLPEKRNLGYVQQDYALFPHLSVYKNIEFGLKIKKIAKPERAHKIREISSVLGIEHLLTRSPRTLSGGEQQRTALARALITNPKILLMDEPFSALDYQTKQNMYKMIKKIHRIYGCTIVFVTHDLKEAQELAHRVGVIDKGQLKSILNSADLNGQSLYSEGWQQKSS